MDTNYENGRLSFKFDALLDLMGEQDKVELVERLACDCDLIKHVTSQILDGWTENGSHGLVNVIASDNPYYGLDWAWRQVALRASEVAKREIERLCAALADSEAQLKKANEVIYARALSHL